MVPKFGRGPHASEASQAGVGDVVEASQASVDDVVEAAQASVDDVVEASQASVDDVVEASQASVDDAMEASQAPVHDAIKPCEENEEFSQRIDELMAPSQPDADPRWHGQERWTEIRNGITYVCIPSGLKECSKCLNVSLPPTPDVAAHWAELFSEAGESSDGAAQHGESEEESDSETCLYFSLVSLHFTAV